MIGQSAFIGDSRDMSILTDDSVDLVVTSPPYWHIKDYGIEAQIGHGQDLHSYLKDLYLVWKECIRVLRPGRRICINIGDQFARASLFGRYKVIPLHAEVISQLEMLGMDFMGSIIWRKRTTMNTSGGAVVMGSYPFPPNGIVEIDYEHILIFRKPGKVPPRSSELKEGSKMTKEEWKTFHLSHWTFPGERQISHEAMFPMELPSRLIRMFTFRGETVLDPFLGSGTTLKASLELGRKGMGFELNGDFIDLIKRSCKNGMEITHLVDQSIPEWDDLYIPRLTNAYPPTEMEPERDLIRVSSINDDLTIVLQDGQRIDLAGLLISHKKEALNYLRRYVQGKEVTLKEDDNITGHLVFLKNMIFVNGELIKRGHARVIEGDGPVIERLKRIQERINVDH